MNRNYAKFFPLVFLFLSSLYACNNKTDDEIILFTGQVYPNQHVDLQSIVTSKNKFNAWPTQINVYPLYAPGQNKNTEMFQATFVEQLNNVYVPLIENMPEPEQSKCTPDGYQATKKYQYLLNDNMFIQDYFNRGMPDNCETEDNVTRYRTERNILTSFPVIAITADQKLNLNFQNTGKLRPLSLKERNQVTQYIQDFKAEFKKAYGSRYDEKTNNIGKIPTLAGASILLEADVGNTGYTIRVSTWERITVAYHIYRVIEVSILKNDELIQTNETSRFQGVLG